MTKIDSKYLLPPIIKFKSLYDQALVIGRTPLINHEHFESISFNDIDLLSKVLNNVEILVHLAARSHIMNETAIRPLDEYRNTNTVGTLNLLEILRTYKKKMHCCNYYK